MTILETFIKLRDDLKLWVTNNLKTKADISDVDQKSQVQMIADNTTEILPTLKIHKLTQEEYDQQLADGAIDENALYLTPDEEVDLSNYATEEYVDGAIAAIPTPDVSGQIESHNTNPGAHEDIRSSVSNLSTLVGSTAVSAQISDAIGKIDYPVSSVNGKTGSVTLTASDVGALSADTVIPSIDGLATEEYADNAANAIKNDLLNGAGEAYDTLKELGDLISENVDAIEALETIATSKADSVHSHNDLYYNKTEIDSSLRQKSQVQIITWEADD